MSRIEATKLLMAALKPKVDDDAEPQLTVSELRDKYLEWVKRNRSEQLYNESRRHLARFCRTFGRTPAVEIRGADLEKFTDGLLAKRMTPLYVRKHATSVRTLFSRGRKATWLPADCRPFANVEGVRVDKKPLLEANLPTADEVRRLFAAAEGVMLDFLTLYFNTGARTHELAQATVGDFQPTSRTIVLGRHKRSHTMRSPTPRTISLNEAAFAVVERRCDGRPPSAPLIANGHGGAYTSGTLSRRFANLRKRAKVRDHVTVYSFRHLWISECLMAGLDSMIIAKMAGTSVRMIESVYGHFRTSSFRDAQAQLDALRGRGSV